MPATLDSEERAKLREILESLFSLEELETLAFDLGVSYDKLPHATVSQFARELIGYFDRRGSLKHLITKALSQRDDDYLARLARKLPADSPRIKVQIRIAQGVETDASDIVASIASMLSIDQNQIELIGVVHGSLRLLVSLPEDAANVLFNTPVQDILNGRYQIIEITSFDRLDVVSQENWQRIVRSGARQPIPWSNRQLAQDGPDPEARLHENDYRDTDSSAGSHMAGVELDEQNRVDLDSQARWLELVQLRDNPFRHVLAEKEPNLPKYSVPLSGLSIRTLVIESRPWLVLAEAGSGKTALQIQVAAYCRDHPELGTLCIQYGTHELEAALEMANDSLDQLEPIHHARSLCDQAIRLDPRLAEVMKVNTASLNVSSAHLREEVFVSYAREDRTSVVRVTEQLYSSGVRAWYDSALTGGQYWTKELENRILTASALLAVLSRNSERSDWMSKEALFAQQHGVPVIPYLLEDIQLPIWAVNLQAIRTVGDLIAALNALTAAEAQADRPVSYAQNLPSAMEEHGAFTPSRAGLMLEKLATAARKLGYKQVLCLVDQVDTFLSSAKPPAEIGRFLNSLLLPSFRERDGVSFRYFLPTFLEPMLKSQAKNLRLDRCKMTHVNWTEQNLRDLLKQRLTFFSVERRAPYISLGQFCEGVGRLAETIDGQIVNLAEGNPRATIWLANRLFEKHCESPDPSRLIRTETWERVHTEWWQSSWSHVFSASTRRHGLRVVNESLYYQNREVPLSGRNLALLRSLVAANGNIRSKSDLVAAAWPGEDSDFVTDAAVAEATRRLKSELQRLHIPVQIETIRGRGYRIDTTWDRSTAEQSTAEGLEDGEG